MGCNPLAESRQFAIFRTTRPAKFGHDRDFSERAPASSVRNDQQSDGDQNPGIVVATTNPIPPLTMNPSTHAAVAQRAHQLWQDYGQPTGRDTEIWLEAERQHADESETDSHPASTAETKNESGSAATLAERVRAETAAESVVEYHLSPAPSDEVAITAAMQKIDARRPRIPHKEGPKAHPTGAGKPLWSRPHSS